MGGGGSGGVISMIAGTTGGGAPSTIAGAGGAPAASAGASGSGGGGGKAGAAGAATGGIIHAGDGVNCDHSFANANCWAIYDLSQQHPTGTFMGGAFDGRYVYFASKGNANATAIVRYDTHTSFSDAGSFSVFDLATVNTKTHSFAGAAFDGRYFYLVPFDWTYSTQTTRYDTQAEFGAASSWANFDLTPISGLPPFAVGYVGAVFDGRYLYYVPNCIYEYWRGMSLRFDTRASFDSLSAWSSFDTLTLDDSAGGYRGGAFDGRYLYLSPYGDLSSGALLTKPLATRYDTQADFAAKASWATFDMSALSNTPGYAGAVFDGKYVYFPAADFRGRLTRFDTRGAFEAASSWAVFEMSSALSGVNDQFNGGVFDGRYLYLVPESKVAVRYDTSAAFDSKGAYESFDLAPLDARSGHLAGGVFDGRYVYFVPASSNHVVRFEARADRVLPAGNNASFY